MGSRAVDILRLQGGRWRGEIGGVWEMIMGGGGGGVWIMNIGGVVGMTDGGEHIDGDCDIGPRTGLTLATQIRVTRC
jgi:hypothetical protein